MLRVATDEANHRLSHIDEKHLYNFLWCQHAEKGGGGTLLAPRVVLRDRAFCCRYGFFFSSRVIATTITQLLLSIRHYDQQSHLKGVTQAVNQHYSGLFTGSVK